MDLQTFCTNYIKNLFWMDSHCPSEVLNVNQMTNKDFICNIVRLGVVESICLTDLQSNNRSRQFSNDLKILKKSSCALCVTIYGCLGFGFNHFMIVILCYRACHTLFFFAVTVLKALPYLFISLVGSSLVYSCFWFLYFWLHFSLINVRPFLIDL